MTRRRVVLAVGLVVGLGLLGALAALLLPSGPGVTKTNYDRVEDGMPLGTVVRLLGPPAVTSPGGRDWSVLQFIHPENKRHTRVVWAGDGGGASVEFDPENRVVQKDWFDAPEPFRDRLRRRYPWLPSEQGDAMPRRLLPLVVGLAGLGLLALASSWWLVPRRGVSQANYDRIQVGWTEAQVRAVLGNEAHVLRPIEDSEQLKTWFGDDQAITVSFRDGRVADKHFGPVFFTGIPPGTFWDWLRHKVGL